MISTPADAPAGPAIGRLDEVIGAFDAVPGGRTLDPAALLADTRAVIQSALGGTFGTPSAPRVGGVAADAIAGVSLAPESLAAGSRLYAAHCAHCHGLAGSGRGFGATYLYPHPRDFRAGVFKVGSGITKPTARRLGRLLREGVPGSSMPMFDLISDADIEALVGYVIHLSVRGEVETRLIRGVLDDELGLTVDDVPGEAARSVGTMVRAWATAVEPEPVPGINEGIAGEDAVRRGHELFVGAAGCVSCHTNYGRAERYQYDIWGGAARPADVTQKPSDYRWGHRPADLAHVVRHGIAGARMPASTLADGEVADIVAFVRAAGAGRLPDDVRGRLYPAGTK